jgi:hypothetical protein
MSSAAAIGPPASLGARAASACTRRRNSSTFGPGGAMNSIAAPSSSGVANTTVPRRSVGHGTSPRPDPAPAACSAARIGCGSGSAAGGEDPVVAQPASINETSVAVFLTWTCMRGLRTRDTRRVIAPMHALYALY